MNLSISRINPVGLRILSLRGCTAACIVKVGFEGSWGGVVGGRSWGLDNGSEVKACCMLRVRVRESFLGGCCVVLHAILALSVAWLWATLSLPVCLLPAERCGCWPMPSACRTHGFGHARHSHTLRNTSTYTTPPPSYCRACHL